MKITIPYCYTEEEIPPRCRKPRRVEHAAEMTLTFGEITEAEAPVAIVWDKERFYQPNNGGAGQILLRWYKNRLWAKWCESRGVGAPYETQTAAQFQAAPYPQTLNAEQIPWHNGVTATYRTRAENRRALMKWARETVFINGERWAVAGEPRYEIATFGLGNNHGGTAVFVQTYLHRGWYFRLDEKEKAFAAATAIAERRGDTKDVPITETNGGDTFKILIPEAIRLKPRRPLD